jgi:hypothetical protein
MWCLGSAPSSSSFSSGHLTTDVPATESMHWLAIGIMIIMLSLTGCGFISTTRVTINERIGPQDVVFIVPGKTTFKEIVTHLGAPDALKNTALGPVVAYHFRDAKHTRINLGWPTRFFLPVSPDLVLSGGGLGADVFQVFFDAHWVAQTYAFGHHTGGPRFNPWPF